MKIPNNSYQWLSWLRILIVFGVVIYAAVAVHHIETHTVDAAGKSLARVAADMADKLDLLLFERYGDMQTMAKSEVFRNGDISAIDNYLALLHQAYPIYRWLAVTDADGRVLAASDPSSVGGDRSGELWFQSVRNHGGIHIQDAETSPEAGGVLAVGFSAPIVGSDKQFLGAVTARVGVPDLQKIFDRTLFTIQMPEGTSARGEWHLLDKKGNLLADSLLHEEGKVNLLELGVSPTLIRSSEDPGYVETWHQRRGVEIVRGYAGTKGIGEFPGLNWTVLINLDRKAILTPLHGIVRDFGIMGSVVFVPLVVLLYWLTYRLKREWGQAQTEAARAAKAEQQYRAARDQLADVLDHAPDPIFFTDTKGTITRFSRGAQKVLGYDTESIASHDVRELFMDPNQWPPIFEEWKRKGEVIGREIELRARAGHAVHISLTLAALKNASGEKVGVVGLCKDVTAAKRIEESLRISNEELESFVYAISHDLQAPLRGIQGFAVLLLKRAAERLESQERHYLERIRKGAERMEELIRDLLEYSRIERITYPWALVSMEQIVLQARKDMDDRIRQSQAEVRIEEGLPWVYGDRVRLVQLWSNLLSNAIKYAKPGEPACISIGYRKEGQDFIFWIRDKGIGIAPEFFQKIFGVFNRLHTQDQIEGTGIGLAIVKRIVEFHKGKVWLESVEGEGSTFLFSLPQAHRGPVSPETTGHSILPAVGSGTLRETSDGDT
jgi:PAS domain S-box-containing protein